MLLLYIIYYIIIIYNIIEYINTILSNYIFELRISKK